MFQTLSPRTSDAIHPVLLGRVWLVRLVYMPMQSTQLNGGRGKRKVER
jgi:hypothetical protein